jgi:hypothetical protein
MRKRLVFVVVATLAACGGPRLPRDPTSGPPVVEVGGLAKDGPFRLGRADLAALPRRSFSAVDPATGAEAVYEGAAVAVVLADRVVTKKGADLLVVRTADQEAIPVPLWIVRQFRPILADSADGRPLDALVLAWPNVDQAGLETDPRALSWWARGVVGLDLADSERSFGRALRPPPGAGDAVRLGAEQVGHFCIACHAVRGAGGTRGPDVVRAAAALSPDAFARRVAGHRLAPRAHPEVAPSLETIGNVQAFLRAVGAAQAAGSEEPAEERRPDERDDRRDR